MKHQQRVFYLTHSERPALVHGLLKMPRPSSVGGGLIGLFLFTWLSLITTLANAQPLTEELASSRPTRTVASRSQPTCNGTLPVSDLDPAADEVPIDYYRDDTTGDVWGQLPAWQLPSPTGKLPADLWKYGLRSIYLAKYACQDAGTRDWMPTNIANGVYYCTNPQDKQKTANYLRTLAAKLTAEDQASSTRSKNLLPVPLIGEPDSGQVLMDYCRDPTTGDVWGEQPAWQLSAKGTLPSDLWKYGLRSIYLAKYACQDASIRDWMPTNIANGIYYCTNPQDRAKTINYLLLLADKLEKESSITPVTATTEEIGFCATPPIGWLEDNLNNGGTTAEIIQQAVALKDLRWPKGKTVKVAFDFANNLDFTSYKPYMCQSTSSPVDCQSRIQTEVATALNTSWSQYGNIHFKFGVPWSEGEIRVRFVNGSGGWSYVGTQAFDRPKDQNTMELGLTYTTAQNTFKGTVIHEFGHAIGFMHEHQSPKVPYTWNIEQVVQDFYKMGWPREKVIAQVLTPLDKLPNINKTQLFVTEYDPLSIMMYWIPSSWVSTVDKANTESCPSKKSEWCVEPITELSAMDKWAVAQMYPFADITSDSCTYDFESIDRLNFSEQTQYGKTTVTTQSGCPWEASSKSDWITIVSGNSGKGTGIVTYAVAPNLGSSPETGMITIAGKTLTITVPTKPVSSASCSYEVSPTLLSLPAAGDSGSINVVTQPGCDWAASSNTEWIAIEWITVNHANGTGSVVYSADPNSTSSAKTGIITVAGKTVTVTIATNKVETNANCQVDTTQAPEIAEYAKTTLLLCETYSPFIWEKLYKSTSSLEEVKIFFKKGLQAPGQTVGGVGVKSFIELNAEYLTQKPQEQNVVIHEMVHVAQSYSGVNPVPPSWVIEGMADYITHSLGFSYDWTHPTCQGGLHYTGGYWCGSAFFGFLEKTYDSNFVFKLNTAIKANQYRDSLFEDYTGKALKQLWQECLLQDCVGGKQESSASSNEFVSVFKRVEYYKPTGYCSANMTLVWLLFEASGMSTSNLLYVEEKSIYHQDPANPYLEPIKALNLEGLVVRGFCAPPTLKSDFQVRLKQSSTGQLSNVMTFTVDVGSAVVSQEAPQLTWLSQ